MKWQIGDVTIYSVHETDAGTEITQTIPQATNAELSKMKWLQPDFIDEKGNIKAQVQAFVVKTKGRAILVDACNGNGRHFSEFPKWNNLQTNFMQNLSKICLPEKIDFVVNTHFHFDHVGWNTQKVRGKWQPTFENARYLFVDKEFDYWKTKPQKELADDNNNFDIAVMPVYEAGLAELVSASYQIANEVKLVPTHGHTPGHVSVLIESRGQSALITGDAFHHPCQIAHPEWVYFETDKKMALETRLQLLKRFAGTNTFMLGSHFADPVGGLIRKTRQSYRFETR